MDTLRIKERKPVEDEVENWDDDDFLIDGDDLTFRNSSASILGPPHRRDSHSSLVSMRSERESIHGEEETQVYLPTDDEKSTLNAIAIAANAGIPIPRTVPASALAGTIRRLGGHKVKRVLHEDWSDDLMFPDSANPLCIKTQDPSRFPDILRQVSSTLPSPLEDKPAHPFSTPGQPEPTKTPVRTLAPPINLERYRDTEDDEDLFGDGNVTIKVSKQRQVSKPTLTKIITSTPPPPRKEGEDDFEKDLELPSDGTLKLSARRDIPKTPVSSQDDFDWGEGSLGTRFGGTRRDGRSNRSSSASAFSPSIASTRTVESEDEAQLDGIELPHGPLDLKERLTRQRLFRSPEHIIEEEPVAPLKPATHNADEDNFFSGLDVGDGSVFGTGKFKLHNNVKVKDSRTISPARPKTAVSLTFTNKPMTVSRLPRPAPSHHERTHTQSSLEPVSESGGPIVSRGPRRSQSRLGHMSQSSQSSTASNPTPITPSGPIFSSPSTTPRKKEIGQKSSTPSLRTEPTTTNAQLLRLKRSLPAMKPSGSHARSLSARTYERPPSRTSMEPRPLSAVRPKTPTERARHSFGENSAALARKPFLPAGASSTQSYNVNARRALRRHDSDNSLELRPISRTVSRSAVRSPSPSKPRNLEKLARAGTRQPLSLPKRARHFGDGHELDAFDDLPTSAKTESEFVKQPKLVHPQYPTQFRNKVMPHLLPGRTNSPAPTTPHSPAKSDNLPRFARDTASSRIARETNLAHRVPSSGPLTPLTSQRVAQLSTRNNLHPLHPPQGSIRSKKLPRKHPQLKPHLISNLNSSKDPKSTYLPLLHPRVYLMTNGY